MEKIDVDSLIAYYSKIPTKRWTVNYRSELKELAGGKAMCFCALGLLHSHEFGISKSDVDCINVEIFICELPDPTGIVKRGRAPLVRVNNGRHDNHGGHPIYQKIYTPKSRVLKFLKDVRKKFGNLEMNFNS